MEQLGRPRSLKVTKRTPKRAALPAALALLIAGIAVSQEAAPAPALAFPQVSVDAGEIYQFAVLEHRFEFTNASDREIHITGVQAGDPAAQVDPESGVFAAGSLGSIWVRQPVGPRLGEVAFRFTVLTDDPTRPSQELVLNAFVQSAYDTELPFLDFGDVDQSRGQTLSLEVSSRETAAVDLVQVLRAPAFIEVTPAERTGVAGESLSLNVTLKPAAPQGLHADVLHLRTNVAHHPDYLVRIRASVFGDIVPSESPLQLGAVRIGEGFTVELRLNSRTGRAFSVGAVRDSRGWLNAGARPCTGGRGPSDCWIVTAKQTPMRPGRLDGVLEAQIDDQQIPLSYAGLAVARNATIRNLGQIDRGVQVEHTGSEDGTER